MGGLWELQSNVLPQEVRAKLQTCLENIGGQALQGVLKGNTLSPSAGISKGEFLTEVLSSSRQGIRQTNPDGVITSLFTEELWTGTGLT